MLTLGLIQLFWLALALPGYAALRLWDRESLERGLMFGLARCYLASFTLLTPVAVLGYFWHWPLWTLSSAYVLGVSIGVWALVRAAQRVPRDWRSLKDACKPNWLAAISCSLICFDLWLGLRAGTHTLGDAGYHIARVRMLVAEGLSNWDPIIQQPRLDVIYHTNLYHALIAVSAQLTRSDAALAWIATWPFAKLLVAAAVAQLAGVAFGAASYGWLASLALLASQSAYSALPLPNTLAPLALLPLGLCAGAELLSGARRPPLTAAWLAASAIALAQLHALNAMFLALVVAPVLLLVLIARALPLRSSSDPTRRRQLGPRALALGMLACAASAPWLAIAGADRIQGLLLPAASAPASAEPREQANLGTEPPPADAEPTATEATSVEAPNVKTVYKAERFRKLANGLSVYEPNQLRGAHDVYLIGLFVAVITLVLRPRAQLAALLAFVAMACAWLVVPQLCSLLLFVTGAPWAALRISQVLPVVFYALVPAAPMFWYERFRPAPAALAPVFALVALLVGWSQIGHGEPWTPKRLWEHALQFQARTEWESIAARQALLCEHIPPRQVVMAHPRWDYGLPMHCRIFAVALAPGRGWHGMPYMPERRADVDEFFRDGTTGERRIELMRKYTTHYVYTSQRLARRIVSSLPKESRILAHARAGAVLSIDY